MKEEKVKRADDFFLRFLSDLKRVQNCVTNESRERETRI